MQNIVLPNVPESILASLRERALRHGVSIEQEAMNCLGQALGESHSSTQEVDRVLAAVDQFRESLGELYLTEEELQQAKQEGRP